MYHNEVSSGCRALPFGFRSRATSRRCLVKTGNSRSDCFQATEKPRKSTKWGLSQLLRLVGLVGSCTLRGTSEICSPQRHLWTMLPKLATRIRGYDFVLPGLRKSSLRRHLHQPTLLQRHAFRSLHHSVVSAWCRPAHFLALHLTGQCFLSNKQTGETCPRTAKDQGICCGQTPYVFQAGATCCGDSYIVQDSGTKCCNGQAYTPNTQRCWCVTLSCLFATQKPC